MQKSKLDEAAPAEPAISETAAQKELQEFAYIVSHDLTAPARHVKQFTELLCRRIDDKLGVEEKEFAAILLNSADRMQDMLSALLTFSRVLTTENKPVLVDMNALAADVAKRAFQGTNSRQPVFEAADLPAVIADRRQLLYVMEQLFDNAIKFRKKKGALRIRVTGSSTEQLHQIAVSDNGIGVPADRRAQAFRMFQRLHGPDYAGLGAGLTISRKIIETHGGRMWIADASPGTTVVFTLPAGAASSAPQRQ